tara:strand:- start:394 stop:678 length:285 start_codon:yes stop_codon:yes gene_type:complete
MSIDAMKLALEALEYYRSGEDHQPTPASESITTLRTALEQPRQWQGLTDDAITEAIRTSSLYMKPSPHTPQPIWLAMLMGYARAIEAKLREKNT